MKMIKIKKNKEPNSLVSYKKKEGACYDGPNFTDVKNDIKESLLQEQGYICAYCMCRISKSTMKVEHWECQSKYPEKQLEYKNLLGCCKGGEGFSPMQQTCDTHKGNLDIIYSPTDAVFSSDNFIRYTPRGKIASNNERFNLDINDILHLNDPRLISNRKIMLDKIQKELHERKGGIKETEINRLITKYNQKNCNNEYLEYFGVIVSYLMAKKKTTIR